MSFFIELWMSWVHIFKGVPYPEYVAAIVFVGLVIFAVKKIKGMSRYV